MGKRKRESANLKKEARRNESFAKLRNVPSSPRKMRLVADMVRGVEVFKALGLLHFSNKQAASDVEVLLKSAISNWEPSRLMPLRCSSASARLPRVAAIASANVPTT